MRGTRGLAIAACCGALALFGAGCGGDDESASQTVTTESTPAETQTAPETTSQDTNPSATVVDPPAQRPNTVTSPPSSQGGGATVPADPSQPDSPSNDTPPPAGSPAERYEQQCKTNPQTCGD